MASRGSGRGGGGGAPSSGRNRGDYDGGSPSGGQGSGRPKARAWGDPRGGPSPAPTSAGHVPAEKGPGEKAASVQDLGYIAAMDPAQQEAHTRMLYVLMNAVGTVVQVSVKDGSVYEGILSHSGRTDGELGLCLKMARRRDDGESPKVYPELIVPPKELVMMTARNVEFAPDKVADVREAGFMTDTAISGVSESRERELVRWAPSEADEPLESLGGDLGGRGAGKWDQFAVNEQRFGVTTDYHEEFYTTKLDRSGADFKQREREAARLAAEIEKAPAAFAHVAEERGLTVDDGGMDEEEKYSSVVRTPGKYVPPGARKPSLAGEASPATPEVSTPSEQPSSDAGTPVSAAGQKSTDTLSNEPATAGKKPPQLPPQLQNVTRQPVRGGKDAGTNIDSTLNAFRDYSQKEKERLGNAMRDVHNRDRNNLLNDFKKFSHDFQIKAPIPADLEPILHKTKTSSKPGSATGAVSTSPAPASASPTSAPDTKSPESETKEATSTTEERAATPSSTTEKSKEDKKEFKFNVEAEEFTFNVGAAEFVPGGPPANQSGTKSPAFDKKGPNPARRTPSQSSWGQGGPRPPMNRNVYQGGYEEMPMMPMGPQYPPMGPMEAGPGGYYPVPAPYAYGPPGMVVAPRPAFIPGGPPPMAMMGPGQPSFVPYPAAYGPPGQGPRSFPQQMMPVQVGGPPPRYPNKGNGPMSPQQSGMYPPGGAPPRVPMQYQQQPVVMMAGPPQQMYAGPPPTDEAPGQ